MDEPSQLPITIIGGYLGAGKTTLVNHLLRNANGLRLAILVNEFGALPIDEDLIEAQEDNLISLSGGCVCCSYGNDLTMALLDLAQMNPAPDHVVLEASGVALPGAIGASLSLLSGFMLDGILVLADAETIKARGHDPYMGDTIVRQLEHADIVVLNKTDLVGQEALADTKQWLVSQVPGAQLIEAQQGRLPLSIALQDFRSTAMDMGNQVHTKDGAVSPHFADLYESHHVIATAPMDVQKIACDLAENQPEIVRAKGFVKDLDGVTKTIQVVGRRFCVEPAPTGATLGLVLIGLRPMTVPACLSAHC